MKKLIFASAILIASCNSPKTESVICDSTKCDSLKVIDSLKVDTLDVRGVVDTTILKSIK